MKKLFVAVFILFSMTLCIDAQEVVNNNGPEIEFEKTTHQFGEIPYKGNAVYEFVFKNTGNEPLILTQPKSSCGCTVNEKQKRPILHESVFLTSEIMCFNINLMLMKNIANVMQFLLSRNR